MIHQRIVVVMMSATPRPAREKQLPDGTCYQYSSDTKIPKSAFVERLPFALTYAASLEPEDCAVLFYDNIVVAAEYFCAFIEEGIKCQEVTCFTGLDARRYQKLFEQVGVRVAELENCGYMRNLSIDELSNALDQFNENLVERNNADPLEMGMDNSPRGVRFVHIHESNNLQNSSPQDLMDRERKAHKFSSFPTTSICCYDAKLVLEDTSSGFFKELLEAHNHCFFQGVAMPTSRLLGLQKNEIYPKLRSA